MKRRSFLASMLAAGVAPAFVGSGVLMPVKKLWVPPMSVTLGTDYWRKDSRITASGGDRELILHASPDSGQVNRREIARIPAGCQGILIKISDSEWHVIGVQGIA